MQPKHLHLTSSFLALVGVADAAFLTFEHYRGDIPPCTVGGCEQVLTSPYATLGGVPIALLGLGYYLTILLLSRIEARWALLARFAIVSSGLVVSGILAYIQIGILRAICLYCMTSAAITLLLWLTTLTQMQRTQGGTHAN